VLSPSIQIGRHAFVDRGQDLYETPPSAVEALLKAETLPHRAWEPAAGRGAIAEVFRVRGHEVVASDIDCGGAQLNFYADFFSLPVMPAGCEAICTNSLYGCADAVVQHALDLAPQVYLLLRLAFLESGGRTNILERRELRIVHVFRKRLHMMHRAGWAGRRATSAIPSAWFCWDQSHAGPATRNRISTCLP
jgi:hypothetical protein